MLLTFGADRALVEAILCRYKEAATEEFQHNNCGIIGSAVR
jgi:hypothetical protein